MTEKISITIEGRQAGMDEPVVMTAIGTYHFINGRHYIQYDEAIPDTGEVTKNIIKINKSGISLTKKGKQSSQLEFDFKEKTQAIYHTPYGNLTFGVSTKSINMREEPGRIEVRLSYSLYADDSHVSDNTISIRITEEDTHTTLAEESR
jgi:uncharacterized beta-barrel protein YwiB (DUF1934 family)